MINFLFDVDGTLTSAREEMDSQFKDYFYLWMNKIQSRGNTVSLVTGSDRDKTVEQLGMSLWKIPDYVYQCSGNQLFKQGNLIKESDWQMSDELRLDVNQQLTESIWFGRATNNIEERIGTVNISTLGRDATKVLRKEYFEWDNRNEERIKIAEKLSSKYKDLEFTLGGEISIDIFPKGKDKSQVFADIEGHSIFFGDKCFEGGNDYSISLMADVFHQVMDWRETRQLLEFKYG